jgi:mannose-6-phosphate isomerase-like protein (cupin superfamily)
MQKGSERDPSAVVTRRLQLTRFDVRRKGMYRFVTWWIFFAVVCPAMPFAQDEPARQDTAKRRAYTIENCVNAFDSGKTVKTKVGYQYWFADRDFADGKTLKMSVVAPHAATHAPHVHQEDEFFFILEGHAECILQGQTKVVGPYTSFYCPSNVEHGIRNAGDTVLKYLVIKKYVP